MGAVHAVAVNEGSGQVAQPLILALQLLVLAHLGQHRIGLGAAFEGRPCTHLAARVLFAPFRQHRGVDAFPAQQRAYLSGLPAPIGFTVTV